MNKNIPNSVVKGGEQADQLIAALSAGNTDLLEGTATGEEQSSAGQVETQEPSTQGVTLDSGIDSQSTTDNEQQVSIDGSKTVRGSAPQEETVEYWKEQAGNWEHKYQSLAGKYNKEIEQQKLHYFSAKPELDQLKVKNEELESTVQTLESQIAQMQKEKPSQPEGIFESAEMKERLAQIAETYGDDLANGMRMLIETGVNSASALTSTQIDDLSQKVNTVESKVEDVKHEASAAAQEQDKQAVWDSKIEKLSTVLEGIGINFKQVDEDERFHAWASKFDSETGTKRLSLMMALLDSEEYESVAGMYAQFVEQNSEAFKESNLSQSEATQEPKQEPTHAPNFQEQVQVQSTAPVREGIPKESPKWTSEAISKFYRDVATGNKYSREEAERIEQEIFAQSSGR